MINRIIVKGERCSGTNYLRSLIQTNFKNIMLSNELGWKHSYLNTFNENLHKREELLVLIIFRNPYEWLNSLYQHPWHLRLTDGKNFLTDLSFSNFLRYNPYSNGNEGDKYKGLLDVKFMERHPFTLKYPEDVFEIRNWKIENFLNHSEIFPNIMFIRYEDLVTSTKIILDQINEKYLFKDYIFNNVDFYKGSKNAGIYKPKKYPKMSDVDFNYFLNKVDWSLEEKIGYKKTNIEILHNKLQLFD